MPRKKKETLKSKKCRNLEVGLGPFTTVYDERADDGFMVRVMYPKGGDFTFLCLMDSYDQLIEVLSKTKELVDEMKKEVDKSK